MNTAAPPRRRPRAAVDTAHPDALLHGDAVRQLVGVSADTLRRWIAAGVFPQPLCRIGRRPRWHCGDVLDWLRSPRKQTAV